VYGSSNMFQEQEMRFFIPYTQARCTITRHDSVLSVKIMCKTHVQFSNLAAGFLVHICQRNPSSFRNTATRKQ
jgi:hypothetical protein